VRCRYLVSGVLVVLHNLLRHSLALPLRHPTERTFMTVQMNDEPRVAFLFPGQGGFDGPALQTAAREYPQVKAVLERIDRVTDELFGRRITDMLLGGSPPDIADLLADASWVSQLAIYGSGLAAFDILLASGVTPTALVGHSLGEITAVVAAGAFTIEDGARIVVRRVQAIDDIEIDGRMVALACSSERALHLIDLIGDPMVAVATINHDEQTIVSGPSHSIEKVLAVAATVSIPTVALSAAFPFHTPLLAPAVEPFAAYVRRLNQQPMHRPVLSPIMRRYYEPDDSLAELLSRHFVNPVHFSSALRELHAGGYDCFVECGGRSTLIKLTSKVLTDGQVRTLASLTQQRSKLALNATLHELRSAGLAVPVSSLSVADIELLGRALARHESVERFVAFWADQHGAIVHDIGLRLATWTPTPDVGVASAPAHGVSAVEDAATVVGVVPAVGTGGALVDRRALFDAVSQEYALALEYPADVFADDVLLEAELGVDSVKQIELLSRVSAKYGLPPRSDSFRLSEFDTLDKVVSYIAAELESRAPAVAALESVATPDVGVASAPAHGVSAVEDAATVVGVVPAVDGVTKIGAAVGTGGALVDRRALFDAVSQEYALALEYPADVFADDVLLEAELGVDSVKQIELLSRVSAKYGLPPRSDSFRLSEFDTLDKVVSYIAAEMSLAAAGR